MPRVCIHQHWRKDQEVAFGGEEVNIWRNANVASICMSHWPVHRSHFKSSEISKHPTISLIARSITCRGPVCLRMCEFTTITSKSVNKTISPLDICNNLILFTLKFSSVFYFFVSEMEGSARSSVRPEKRWFVRIMAGVN